MQRLVLALAVTAMLANASSAQASETTLWPAYGHDLQLTNAVDSGSIGTATAPRLRLSWTTKLDGPIVASPVSARVAIDGVEEQVVYVATEAGSVYALTLAGGNVLWQRTFETVTTDNCGTYGFSSTGALDLHRHALYEIGADGLLHALDLATGEEQAGWPLRLIERTRYEYVWGGLQLIDDRLYVPIASYCDEPDPSGLAAEGRLVAVDPDTASPVGTFDPVTGYGNLGGIWGWGGVSTSLGRTTIYTAIGNSYVYSDACSCYADDAGYGDEVVALTPDLSDVLAANKPTTVPATGDEDFGAAPLVFQPSGCPPMLAAKNKMGVLFVWNRAQIDDGPIASFGLGDGRSPFVGAPSYQPASRTLFVSQAVVDSDGPSYGIAAITVTPTCSFRTVWKSAFGYGDQPPPMVVRTVVLDSGGAAGGFGALDSANGHVLWTFPTEAPTISPLIEVDGAVVGGDVDGNLYAFRVASCHSVPNGVHTCMR